MMRPTPRIATTTSPLLAVEYIPALLTSLKSYELIPAALPRPVVPHLVARYVVAPWLPRHDIRSEVSRGRVVSASCVVAAAMTSLSTSVLEKLCAEGDTSLSSKVLALSASLPNVRRIVADKQGLPNSLGAVLRAWGSIEEIVVTSDSCGRIIATLPRSLTSLNVSAKVPLPNLFTSAFGDPPATARRRPSSVSAPLHTFGALQVSLANLTSLRVPTVKRSDLEGLVSLRSLRVEVAFTTHTAVLRLLGGPPMPQVLAPTSTNDGTPVDGGTGGIGELSDDNVEVDANAHGTPMPVKTPAAQITQPLPFLPTLTALSVAFAKTSKPLLLPQMPELRAIALRIDNSSQQHLAPLLKGMPDLTRVSVAVSGHWFTSKYVAVTPDPDPFPAVWHTVYPQAQYRYAAPRLPDWQAVLDNLEGRRGLTAVCLSREAYYEFERWIETQHREPDARPTTGELKAALSRYRVDPRAVFDGALGDDTNTVGPSRNAIMDYEAWKEWQRLR